MNSQQSARMVYRNALRAMTNAGVDPKQAILSQSYLRLERLLSATTTNYQFGVLINDAPQGSSIRASEVRLNLQDAFYVGSVQMFTFNTAAATDTNFNLITYPNRFVYSTAGAAQALYNLYNGYASLTVNNRIITPSWDLYRHIEVNQTQQNNALAAGINIDQLNGADSTGFACEPNWVLIGSKNNVFQVNLPAAVGTLQAASSTGICFILRGILAQNVTVVS